MESEKVKEIKKALETNLKTGLGYDNGKKFCDIIWFADILTYINELESENERLTEERDLFKKQFNELEPRFFDLREENKELKDRIALLEKDNELLRNAKVVYETVDYCYEDLKKAEKRIAELEEEIKENAFYAKGYAQGIKNTYEVVIPDKLKQFAERLKKKTRVIVDFYKDHADKCFNGISEKDIDEALEEFLK